MAESHKLQHNQHARVGLASQLHNKSTTYTLKNFNNQIRHPLVELSPRIRAPSTIV
jgi:hypothetical protein